MIVREANLDDVPAIARVHVDTWRTTYVGIVPERVLANLSYARREETWKKALSISAETKQFTYVVENEARQIYEALGGRKVHEKQIEIGGVSLQEFVYGWTDTKYLRICS